MKTVAEKITARCLSKSIETVNVREHSKVGVKQSNYQDRGRSKPEILAQIFLSLVAPFQPPSVAFVKSGQKEQW
jgi:hypothetical protein